MRFHIMTLFPDMVMQGLNTSIIGRALENKLLDIEAINIRDFTLDKHGKVDDYPYGGGAGMLMQAQPVYDAYCSILSKCEKKPRTIYVTPQGKTFSQSMAEEFSKEDELVILCGHYEGIDERVLEDIVTDYVSIGDYVLTGGELPAMVMVDSIARLVPGVLHNDFSAVTESFYQDLLEYPQYSRPKNWNGKEVPSVLMSGNHKDIMKWRLEKSVERTKLRRPDLYEKYMDMQGIHKLLAKKKRKYIHMMELISRGNAVCLYKDDKTVLLRDKLSGVMMLACLGTKDEISLPDDVVEEYLKIAEELVVCDETVMEYCLDKTNLVKGNACCQACYTKKETLPVYHKEIRQLDEKALPFVLRHYSMYGEEYLAGRIQAGAMFGAYNEGELVGFIGLHSEGSMGMLFVKEEFRKQKIAASLEAYLINYLLNYNYTPYCQIYKDNQASIKLQEKLGLYLCADSMWWLCKK